MSKRRKKVEAPEDVKKILSLFVNGPIKSGYEANENLPNISRSTLERDLKRLVKRKFLSTGKGPRNATPYFLTFKGLIYAKFYRTNRLF